MTRYCLLILSITFSGCSSHPQALLDAPKPGMIGEVRFTTDDNSTTERVSFRTRAKAAEIRGQFESFCKGRGMKPDPRPDPFNVDWFQSPNESIGILISPDAEELAWVTYFYNR